MDTSQELFSFHLLDVPHLRLPGFFLGPMRSARVAGLRHAERFFTMTLGEPVTSLRRYGIRRVAMFAWWRDAAALDDFLRLPSSRAFNEGWHVRLRLYRRWGGVASLAGAIVDASLADPVKPVVAVTLARLKLSQTLRFTRWGKPVERQVRDHPGASFALAAMRPLTTFCTFSIWDSEADMIGMVTGRDATRDGESHRIAMRERARQDFHHEFTTLRFVPVAEFGARASARRPTSTIERDLP